MHRSLVLKVFHEFHKCWDITGSASASQNLNIECQIVEEKHLIQTDEKKQSDFVKDLEIIDVNESEMENASAATNFSNEQYLRVAAVSFRMIIATKSKVQ